MLEKIVKKNLIEIKKTKEKSLISEEIVFNKIYSIFESIDNIDDLSRIEKNKLAETFIFEVHNMYRNNQILEEGTIADYISKAYTNMGMSSMETLIESIVNLVLSKMGMEDGYLKDFIVSLVSTDPKRFITSLKSCNDFSSLISDSLIEALVKNLQQKFKMTGWGWDILRNWLAETLKSTEVTNSLREKMNSAICSFFSGIVDKVKSSIQ